MNINCCLAVVGLKKTKKEEMHFLRNALNVCVKALNRSVMSSQCRIVRNEQHAENHGDRELMRATMGSSRPVNSTYDRRIDRKLARESKVPANPQLCC
jgi:hypothetical protein